MSTNAARSVFLCPLLTIKYYRYSHTLLFQKTHQYASVHTTSLQEAGHNKWSKIKRKKAVADKERSQYTHKYVQKIISAIRIGGSADPEKNLKLASIIHQAKMAGVPKANVESAIKRATSKADSESAEPVLLDGRGGSGYLLLIEAVTDNIKRTRPQIRNILEKNGAVLGDPGSSAFNFEHKALVRVPANTFNVSPDPLELAIEIGAEDVSIISEGDLSEPDKELEGTSIEDSSSAHKYQFKCDIGDLRQVLKSLREKEVDDVTTSFEYLPKTFVELSEEKYEEATRLVEAICEQEDVVEVYSNFIVH